MTPRGLIVAWMPVCPRCHGLADGLGYDVVLLGRRGFRRPWTALFAYPRLVFCTWRELRRRKPSSVVIVAPPILSPLVVLPLARAQHARVAIDIHSGALLDRRWKWSVPLLRFLARRADAAIVTLESLVPSLGAGVPRAVVLPDPLPKMSPGSRFGAGAALSAGSGGPAAGKLPLVVAVAGWGGDEPLAELAAAAEGRPWRLAITGRPRWQIEVPPNVSLTGFLDTAAYVETLAAADAIVVLTTRPETLLAGAWEGIALGKALVLSDTPALRGAFGEAAVFVAATRDSMAAGVEDALTRKPDLEARANRLAGRLRAESVSRLAELAAALAPPGTANDVSSR